MDLNRLEQISTSQWRIRQRADMHVPGILYASDQLVREMDDKVLEQMTNVAKLPGIVGASYAMPDAHWGYGFPIGGVAAFDPEEGGVVSAGGVGYDISCGVRCLLTGVQTEAIREVQTELADTLFKKIPVGVGKGGKIRLSDDEMLEMLAGGAAWAVSRGYGFKRDLERVEERGKMSGAVPERVSQKARQRQSDQMGTLGSGNHYLEVQRVAEIFDEDAAQAFGVAADDVVVSIHCGSRGLGHQIGTEYLRDMATSAKKHGLELPDRELACAPIRSDLGDRYLGAMRSGINCALANRQILTHLARGVFHDVLPDAKLELLYDVSHNTCKEETHRVDGEERKLFVHRKGATRAFGPGHPDLPEHLSGVGQPVLVGGSMGTSSYILAGTTEGEERSFNSACHGAGRAMSRNQARKAWRGEEVIANLAEQGILIRSPSARGVAEEAPGAYKHVESVVHATHDAGLARRVARLEPLVCVKG